MGIRACLRLGMALSLALLAIGLALYLAKGGEVGAVLGPWQSLQAMLAGEAAGFLSMGVLAIIATPLAGVVVALGVFVSVKEWRFAGVALAVLGVVALAILVKLVV